MRRKIRPLAGCTLAAICLIVASLGAAWAAKPELRGGVTLVPVPPSKTYPDAAAPGALQFACAEKMDTLAPFFAERRLRFDRELVRKFNRFPACHIYYEPSVPGFRVLPEDAPVAGLMADIDPLGFVTKRKERIGDSLDIVKAVLTALPRPLDVTLGLSKEYDAKHWPAALEFHFPATAHNIRLRSNNIHGMHPWVQDYLKSGWVNGKRRLLVTRRLYEGRNGDAMAFKATLDGLQEQGALRSNLSWEGGDLQFAANPRYPSRTVLFFGDAAKLYWGKELKSEEYAYVLRTEFGSDDSLDLSSLTPHVDYFVAFLPGARTAIVSQPDSNNIPIARAALDLLLTTHAGREPAELKALASQFHSVSRDFEGDADHARLLINKLRKILPAIPQPVDASVAARLDAVIARFCPNDELACFTPEGKSRLVNESPEDAKALVDVAVRMAEAKDLGSKLLSLIEMQLPDAPIPDQTRNDIRIRDIERMGFKIIRVPRFPGSPSDNWPGISYVNLLLVDKMLFVPAFGLGKVEDEVLATLARQLPDGYMLNPVYARHALMHNGGVHCSFGIFRSVPGSSDTKGDLASTTSE